METNIINLGLNTDLANKFQQSIKDNNNKNINKIVNKKLKKEAMKVPYNENLLEEEINLLKQNGYKYDKKKKCYKL